jgi:lycopene cyclase CruA
MPGGERAFRAVVELERSWLALNKGSNALPKPFSFVQDESHLPQCEPGCRFDVVIAGGGLGLIAGAALAQRGLKVLVFDRHRVGEAHREWNISERELTTLVGHGIFTWDEIAQTIATLYVHGVISFDARGTGVPACPLRLQGVLDVALDAQAVLDLARKRFLEAGGTILEGRTFRKLQIAQHGRVASVFEVAGPHGPEFYGARLAVDTMGSVSPIAVGLNGGPPFDGVCPTAGTVMKGLDACPAVGDVLVSVGSASEGRQLIWEGFPGREGETTVYLFYYDQAGPNEAESQGLLWLFEQYFGKLPTYRKLGAGTRHLRPVFGYIPARYGRSGRTSARGLLCLGDSAAGQSPLTFCGFGSFVRHIGRVASLITFAVKHECLEESDLRAITPHQGNLRVAWVFNRFMQPWKGSDPAATNRLMNIFCKALAEVGAAATTRFLQDRYSFGDYLKIMLTTARRYPKVFLLTARVLGAAGLLKWAGDLSAFALDDAARTLHRMISPQSWKRLERAAMRLSPELALRLAARRTGWSATSR